VEGLESM